MSWKKKRRFLFRAKVRFAGGSITTSSAVQGPLWALTDPQTVAFRKLSLRDPLKPVGTIQHH